MFGFKKQTILSIIDEQIREGEKALISNQGTAEHYQSLADGNKATLARLKLQRAEHVKPEVTGKATVKAPKAALPEVPVVKSAKIAAVK